MLSGQKNLPPQRARFIVSALILALGRDLRPVPAQTSAGTMGGEPPRLRSHCSDTCERDWPGPICSAPCIAACQAACNAPTPSTRSPTHVQHPVTCDDFGVKRVYPSDRISSADDWLSAWTRPSPTILSVAGDLDPLDHRSMMEGIGAIGLGYGECIMVGDARLYIGSSAAHGWADVEVTAYGRVVGESSATALIIGVLANHSDFGEGCSRPAYSARIDVHTGPSGNPEFYTSLFRDSTSLVHGSTKWATIAKPTNCSNCRRRRHRRRHRHHHHHE